MQEIIGYSDLRFIKSIKLMTNSGLKLVGKSESFT